jgi:thioredoxin-dependent peroxiredoxin
MATIKLRGNPIQTGGELPKEGSQAPDFNLLRTDLSRASLASFPGKKILSIFPSIDTPVCATSVRTFNKIAADKGVTVLNISEDLVFAQKRFCGAEGIDKVHTLSAFRSSFGKDYGVEITEGPFAGLTARAIVVIDENNKVIHSELVPEIAQEPNYDAAIAAVS